MHQGLGNCSTGVKLTLYRPPPLASGTDFHPEWPSSAGWHHRLSLSKLQENWRPGNPGKLQSMGSQGVTYDWVTEQQPVLRSVQYLNSHCRQKAQLWLYLPLFWESGEKFLFKAIINQKNSIFWIAKFNQLGNLQQAQANRRAWK